MAYKKGVEAVPGFRLVQFLGRGGFGDVWKAKAPGGTEVALKIISLENKGGFKEFRAIRMVKGIRHPHLVPLYAFWLKDSAGNLFDDGSEEDSVQLKATAAELIIAMGLGDKNLLDRLKECQQAGQAGMPPEELLDYMEETAKAIDFLNKPTHDLGSGPISIQHCDIKPQNIMIVGNAAQVCDFGLARVLGDPRVTQSGGGMSFPYTPPELFTETKPSQSSDQYALAISYVELRTGTLPFENPNQAGMMWAHVQGKLDLSKLPPGEQTVIKRATALDPNQRYPNTLDMVRDLRKAYQGVASGRGSGPRPAQAGDDLQAGTEIVPGYKLVRPLGRGGYGAVWEARAPGGKSVALKIIRNLDKGPGKQEFKALELIKGVEHNHLLELHAYWLLDAQGEIIPDEIRHQPNPPMASTLVIATKLASKNLLQRLHECQQAGSAGIPPAELIGYMRQAALAIDYLNENQHRLDDRNVSIQHRDIKPENILLARDTVKVGDFGLARVVEGTSAVIHGDSTGYTPHYAAPELFGNKVTRWTDQYALAITYYKLRTGAMPFDANGALFDVMMTHVEGKLDLSLLPETERAVIARAASVEPEERFGTCLAMVAALERALSADFPRGDLPPELVNVPTKPAQLSPPLTSVITPQHPSSRPVPAKPTPAPEDGFATVARVEDQEGGLLTEADHHETEPLQAVVPDTDPVLEKTRLPKSSWCQTEGPAEESAHQAAPARPAKSWRTDAKEATAVAPRLSSKKAHTAALVATLVVVSGVTAGGIFVWKQMFPRKENDSPIASSTNNGAPPPVTPPTPIPPAPTSRPRVPTAKEQIANSLRDGQEELAKNNAQQALNHFDKALTLITLEARPDKGQVQQAQFGKVRALGRLPDWSQLRDYLALLTTNDRRDRAFKFAWEALAQAAIEPGDLDAALAALIKLKRPVDLTPQLDQQDKDEVQGLAGRVIKEILRRADVLIAGLPKNYQQIDAALASVEKITLYDPTQSKGGKERRQAAVNNLLAKEKELRSPFNPDDPFAVPFKEKAQADSSFSWLEKAKALLENGEEKVPMDLLKELALAGWYKTKRIQKDKTAEWLADYVPDVNPNSIPFLLVKAQAQPGDDDGRKTAFGLYEDLWQRVKDNVKIPAKKRINTILQPAIQKGSQIVESGGSDAIKQQVANLYVAKGKVIDVDRQEHPDDWPGGFEDVLDSYEKAIKYFPVREAHEILSLHYAQLSQMEYVQARDRNYEESDNSAALAHLIKALDAAKTALRHPDQPASALVAAGLAVEDLAWLRDGRGSFDDAISYYNQALGKEKDNAEYLFDRGRCYYKAGIMQDKPELIKRGRADLSKATAQKLAPDQQVGVSFWLGISHFRLSPPDYATGSKLLKQAIDDGERQGFLQKTFWFDGLGPLADAGRATWTLANKNPGSHLDAAVSMFATLCKYARQCKSQLYWPFAANWLQAIGGVYERKEQPLKALEVYNKGLPENTADVETPELRLFTARNALFTKKDYKQVLADAGKRRSAAEMKEYADKEVQLAETQDDSIKSARAEALFTAALCYVQSQQRPTALQTLQKALAADPDEILKTKIEQIKRELEDQ
jgi:serine/threonine protein kinase/tetratricopeptide (TPR) repeat protein